MMKLIWNIHSITLLSLMLLNIEAGNAQAPGIAANEIENVLRYVPLSFDVAASAEYRWKRKPVLASRLLDGMESPGSWQLNQLIDSSVKVASMSFSTERFTGGTQSIKVVLATKGIKKGGQNGRPWEWVMLERRFNFENWNNYNRLSIQVYPKFEGFKKICLGLMFYNEGDLTKKDVREAYNYIMLEPGKWNTLLFEIAHLKRDQVTRVALMYRLQGAEPGVSDSVTFYADQLELQKVVADKYEGWEPEKDKIIYCHAGYEPEAAKTAFTTNSSSTQFSVINLSTNKTVLQRPVVKLENRRGKFNVFDFSSVRTPGTYKIVSGILQTKPFSVSKHRWKSSLWKTINFFFNERCGFAVAGVHGANHADWQREEYKGQRINLAGGWYDAGDVSQGLQNTADAVTAFFSLAKKYEISDPLLANRLLLEGEWGLQWLVKNRFPDGARSGWSTIDFWTDNIIGTVDDVEGKVDINAGNSLRASIAEAAGVEAFTNLNPTLAGYAKKLAIEDWQLAMNTGKLLNLEYACSAVLASASLYNLTKEQRYADTAISFANYILSCQEQQTQRWSLPLSGFFYRDATKKAIWSDSHLARTDPASALVAICRSLPSHPGQKAWRQCLLLYAEYYKQTVKLTTPYYFFPAAVYDINNGNNADYMMQVKEGMLLDSTHYLRMFPVWFSLRGNNAVQLSHTAGLAATANYLGDDQLKGLCKNQLEWVVGKNPFGQSLMYGEGYDYAPQYSALSGDMVGGLPVGIETREHYDIPYWPAANCYNYKEVWVMPSVYWMQIISEL